MRRLLATAITVGLAWAIATADAQAQRALRINESLGPGSVEEVALNQFKRLVEEGSGGQLRINLFLNDSLGNPQTSLENLITGSLDLYSGAMEYYQPIVPVEIGVLSIPYLFNDHAHMRRYLTSAAFEPARQKLLERGIRFLSTEFNADRGPYRVFISTRQVRQLSDLQGMRIRMFPNEIAIRAWRALGTVPSVLPHTETYLALRQGVVEGAPYPLAALVPARFTEVARFVFRTNEFPQTWPITISERVWRSLNAQQQQLLVRAANEAGRTYAQETLSRTQNDIDATKRDNNAVYTDVELGPFRERMRELHRQLIQEGVFTQPFYDAIVALGSQ